LKTAKLDDDFTLDEECSIHVQPRLGKRDHRWLHNGLVV